MNLYVHVDFEHPSLNALQIRVESSTYREREKATKAEALENGSRLAIQRLRRLHVPSMWGLILDGFFILHYTDVSRIYNPYC